MEAKLHIESIIGMLADLALPFAFAFSAVLAIAIVWLNLHDWKRRKRLSADERRAEDLAADTENHIW